jgi:magnesium chelatase family protein
MMDRIYISVEVGSVSARDLSVPPPREGSAKVAAPVAAARVIQSARYELHRIRTNTEADCELLESVAAPGKDGRALLDLVSNKTPRPRLSPRHTRRTHCRRSGAIR